MAKPVILIYDIEKSHTISAHYDHWQTNIPYDNIIKPPYLMCAAWKVYGKKQINSVMTTTDDDTSIVRALAAAISEADYIVAHNGDRFDIKELNSRALLLGLPPIAKVRSIDTLKVAKKHLRLASNSLRYLAKALKVSPKGEHSSDMFLRALHKEPKALKELVKYNKQDVITLEAVFEKLLPLIDGINHNLFTDSLDAVCKSCGSRHLRKDGRFVTLTKVYQRIRCGDCGKTDKLLTKEKI